MLEFGRLLRSLTVRIYRVFGSLLPYDDTAFHDVPRCSRGAPSAASLTIASVGLETADRRHSSA